mgnify:CR=1 FL=1
MNKTLKKVIIGVAIAVAVVVLVLVGGSIYMVNFALSPAEYNEQEEFAKYKETYPDMAVWFDSLNNVHALRDTSYIDSKGYRHFARFAFADSATTKTAVLVHGYTDSSVMMLCIGEMYHHRLGFNILIPDLYAHGNSDGDAIRMGWLDRLDILEWIRIANEIFGGNTQMVVHGVSMGAATTMMTSGENTPDFVKCFVEDCGYTSVWDQFGKELKEDFHLPTFPLLNCSSLLCDILYDWNFKEASAIEQVKKCQKPMFFIHGDSDDYVITDYVYSLFEAKSEPKEMWIVPETDHAHSFRNHPQDYTQKVREFTQKYIK